MINKKPIDFNLISYDNSSITSNYAFNKVYLFEANKSINFFKKATTAIFPNQIHIYRYVFYKNNLDLSIKFKALDYR